MFAITLQVLEKVGSRVETARCRRKSASGNLIFQRRCKTSKSALIRVTFGICISNEPMNVLLGSKRREVAYFGGNV